MKYIFLVAFMAIVRPGLVLAHDGSTHVESAWYQDALLLTIIGSLVVCVTLAALSYWFPQRRKVFAGIGVISVLVGVVGFQASLATTAPITESVMASLTGVPVTVYRTEGCTCCTGFAKELEATGAVVTTETISPAHMEELKRSNGIAPDQESCHTSVIDGYVVEGHVPFAAIAQLLEERPVIAGITLPGMPIGTPGMPGKQTAVFTVTTLENELYWQSS